MSPEAPKIDPRGYAELVAQTERLALIFCGWGQPEAAPATPAALAGRLLDEQVADGRKVVARPGTLIDAALAARLAELRGLDPVRVRQRGWGLIEEAPLGPELAGLVLAETIYGPSGAALARAGSVAGEDALRGLREAGVSAVRVLRPPRDLGWALIRLFGHMAEGVVERVNRLPAKNLLVFLDLIGTRRIPPQAARVPLTFTPVAGGEAEPFVPALTPVAAAEGAAGAEVVFETERDLTLTRASLVAALVRNPTAGTFADYTAEATGERPDAFDVFLGNVPGEHLLYLANDDLLGAPGPKTVTVALQSPAPQLLASLPLAWSYWDGAAWAPLRARGAPPAAGAPAGLSVVLEQVPPPELAVVAGREARWLRAQLNALHIPLPSPVAPVVVALPGLRELSRAPIGWTVWRDGAWRPTEVTAELVGQELRVTPADPARLPPGGMLRAQIPRPLTPARPGPALLGALRVTPGAAGAAPRVEPLPLAEPCYPFGDNPAAGVACELCLDSRAVAPGAPLAITPAILDRGFGTAELRVTWSYLVVTGSGNARRERWEPLGSSSRAQPALSGAAPGFADETLALTRPGSVSLRAPTSPAWVAATRPTGAGGSLAGHWLRAELTRAGYADPRAPRTSRAPRVAAWSPPAVGSVQITASAAVAAPGIAPDRLLLNQVALDTDKEYFPFGTRPQFNDAFYIRSDAALAQPGATVTIRLTLSDAIKDGERWNVTPSPDLSIVWEGWDGARWAALGGVPAAGAAAGAPAPVSDTTAALTKTGDVTLRLPAGAAPTTVGGEEGYWLRARILRGGYERAPAPTTITLPPAAAGGQPQTISIPQPGTPRPPVLSDVSLSYSVTRAQAPAVCLSVNDFTPADLTAAAAQGPAFAPFTPGRDTRPALYLGFDRPFANRPLALYAQVEPPARELDDRARARDEWGRAVLDAGPPRITWEYAAPGGWAPLSAQDETRGFAERGLVAFVGPADMQRREELGRELYWLRARWQSGSFRALPRLRRILTNTMWASQSATIAGERLGVSDGAPGQLLRLGRAPVLPGLLLAVREPRLPEQPELAALVAAHGPEAVTPAEDGDGFWVCWDEAPDFYSSLPGDRHYVLDNVGGALRFGDGRQGRIPPVGAELRAARYRSGGGRHGDRPAGEVSELRTAIPYVDAVTNLEPALGGADAEPVASLQARGPRALRHRGRAVTLEDYQDLACEASPDVARVLAIPPGGNPLNLGDAGRKETLVVGVRGRPEPLKFGDREQSRVVMFPGAASLSPEFQGVWETLGHVDLVIVPRSEASRPEPSPELIDRVEGYLRERCSAAIEPGRVRVSGPDWYEVAIRAEVAPASLEAASMLERAVVERLRRFLHPLTGGFDGRGWGFGRRPRDSDFYALIEAAPGVDHVRSLEVVVQPAPPEDDLNPRMMVFSGAHSVRLIAPGEGS